MWDDPDMPRVLLVVTGADHWTLADGSVHPTGFWAEEVVAAHRTLTAAGHTVTVATPGGVTPTVDQTSLAPGTVGGVERALDFAAYLGTISNLLQVPQVLEEQVPGAFDAVVLPGGHGPMEDLAAHAGLGRLVTAVADAGGLVVALCHGVAGLLPAVRDDGSWRFAGAHLTAFSDAEERLGGLAANAPWLLETRLRDAGAVVETGPPWTAFVVEDGGLLSGQNPASSEPLARRAAAWLASR